MIGSQTRPVQECLGVCHLDPSLSHSARSYGGCSSDSGFPRHSVQQLILVGRITCWSLIELKAFDHLGCSDFLGQWKQFIPVSINGYERI